MVGRGPGMGASLFVLVVANWAFRRPKTTEPEKFKSITMTSTRKSGQGLETC